MLLLVSHKVVIYPLGCFYKYSYSISVYVSNLVNLNSADDLKLYHNLACVNDCSTLQEDLKDFLIGVL